MENVRGDSGYKNYIRHPLDIDTNSSIQSAEGSTWGKFLKVAHEWHIVGVCRAAGTVQYTRVTQVSDKLLRTPMSTRSRSMY